MLWRLVCAMRIEQLGQRRVAHPVVCAFLLAGRATAFAAWLYLEFEALPVGGHAQRKQALECTHIFWHIVRVGIEVRGIALGARYATCVSR